MSSLVLTGIHTTYTLGATLGTGQYGKAILCQKPDGGQVVVKQVRISSLSPQEQMEAINEVQIMQELDHLNIVKYIECIQQDGCLNIVMEYCRYGELSGLIANRARARKPFTEQEIMFWFVQIALALWQLHSKNILHRDLKLQNIFISDGAILKLGDFGIARVLNSETELVKTAIGTPYYLSPEICQDQPYNRKSDCWALGCVLYELASLHRAFDGGSLPALVVKILKGRYPPLPGRYSGQLRGLVDALLQQDPRARPSIDTILRMDYVKGHLATYAQHVMRLSQTPGAPVITPAGGSAAASNSQKTSSAAAASCAGSQAAVGKAADAATAGRRMPGPPALTSGQGAAPAAAAAATAAAATAAAATAEAEAVEGGIACSSSSSSAMGSSFGSSSSNTSNNGCSNSSGSSGASSISPSCEASAAALAASEGDDGDGGASCSSSPGEQQQQQQQRGRGLLGTGWLERQQAAFDLLQADMAALPRAPAAAAAVAVAVERSPATPGQHQQQQQQQGRMLPQQSPAVAAAAAAAAVLPYTSNRPSPGQPKLSPPPGKKQNSKEHSPNKPSSSRKKSGGGKPGGAAAGYVHAARQAVSPADAVAAARAARMAEKAAWKKQQAKEAAIAAARRAARAAEVEAALVDKAAAAQRQHEESAAAAAAHRQHMKNVQSRLPKGQLAELGAAFRQRLEAQLEAAASSGGGAGGVCLAGGSIVGAGGCEGCGAGGSNEVLLLQESAGGQALLIALAAGNEGAGGGAAAGCKGGGVRRSKSSSSANRAGGRSGAGSSAGASAAQSAAASRRSTPERERQGSAGGAARSPEKPWRVARRSGRITSAAEPGVEIFCPWGTSLDDAAGEQQQQQQQPAELTFAMNLLPISTTAAAADVCGDDCLPGSGCASPQMQRVLHQIQSALAPASPWGASVAGVGVGGLMYGDTGHDALELPPEVLDSASCQLPATAVTGHMVTQLAGSGAAAAGAAGVGGVGGIGGIGGVGVGAVGGGDAMPVAQKIEVLRCVLEKQLGGDMLMLAHRYLEAMQQPSSQAEEGSEAGGNDGDHPPFEVLLSELLGPDKVHLVHLIHKLMMLENQAFRQ